jgi:hypothetical protein
MTGTLHEDVFTNVTVSRRITHQWRYYWRRTSITAFNLQQNETGGLTQIARQNKIIMCKIIRC